MVTNLRYQLKRGLPMTESEQLFPTESDRARERGSDPAEVDPNHLEAPEADAVEQREPWPPDANDQSEPGPPPPGEANPADAAEQAIVVPVDEEEYR
jgi:hypothetical protein